jgi:hypothetical protein
MSFISIYCVGGSNDDGSYWQAGQFLPNDQYYRRSFFGQRTALSSDARFLVVSDTAGGPMRSGRGEIMLYWRRTLTEDLYPRVYANVPLPPLPR